MLEVKKFSYEKHYETVKEWWLAHEWKPIPPNLLSSLGIIVYDGETPIAAGWVYFTNSEWALLEWIVSNPKSDFEVRHEAIILLEKRASEMAVEGEAKMLSTFINNKRLQDKLEGLNWIGTDNVTLYLKNLSVEG